MWRLNKLAYLAQDLGIAQYNDSIFRTGQGDVQTSRIVQESNSLMLVAPDAAENDIVLLPSLEGVDARDLDFLVQIFLERPIKLHIIDDVGALPLVRCNDTNLGRNNTRFEELGYNLFNVRRLSSIMVDTCQRLQYVRATTTHTCSGKTFRSTKSLPAPSSDRRTWVYQERAMGSRHSFVTAPER